MARQGIIGTAGHIDHGKSTLVQALTGVHPDRFAEEKLRGMTIDLGFARLPGSESEPEISFVDVPGHVKFIKNMLAGAGAIDVALLVVAADSGVMPQTREHIALLDALGVTACLVAMTRADLIDPEFYSMVEDDIRNALAGSSFASAPVFPVSSVTGYGMIALQSAIVNAVQTLPEPNPLLPLWLPVDRVFTRPGVGTVLTGSVVSGELRAGDSVTILPVNLPARIKSVERHGGKLGFAAAGHRAAVNVHLPDKCVIERGFILAKTGAAVPTCVVGINLQVDRVANPVKHQQRVHVSIGSATFAARLHVLARNTLAFEDGRMAVQLLLESPYAFLRGQHMAIRTWSPENVIGSAQVVHPHMLSKGKRRDTLLLESFTMQGSSITDKLASVLLTRHASFSPATLQAELAISADDLDDALQDALLDGQATCISESSIVSHVAAKRLLHTAERHLTDFHRKNPLKRGTGRDSLRIPLQKAADVPDYPSLLLWLSARGVLKIAGSIIHLATFAPELPAAWQQAAAEMEAVYVAAEYQPPPPNAFMYPKHIPIAAIMLFLIDQERLIPLGDDIYIAKSVYDRTVETVRQLASTPDGITVGSVRDATGSSRKVVLPLLERLDGLGLTRRVDDRREWISLA